MQQMHAVKDDWIVPVYMLAGPYIYVHMCIYVYVASYYYICSRCMLSTTTLSCPTAVHILGTHSTRVRRDLRTRLLVQV